MTVSRQALIRAFLNHYGQTTLAEVELWDEALSEVKDVKKQLGRALLKFVSKPSVQAVIALRRPGEWVERALVICAEHGVLLEQVTSKVRGKRRISHARQHFMWDLHRNLGLSTTKVGQLLGGRDHTTIVHGVRAHEKRSEG